MPAGESIGLLAVITLRCSPRYGTRCRNTAFDWSKAASPGVRPICVLPLARCFVPCGFEGGLVLMSLPIVMWWTGMSWLEALLADIALALAYVAYAFVFNLAYDRVFPIKA